MADTQNVDDLSAVTVPAKVMAEVLSVGDRQVRNLAEEGILVRNSHGKYLFLQSIKNYILNLKLAKAGEKIGCSLDRDNLDLEQEKAKHEHLKSMITEINLQLIKGQVHKSEDVGRVITDMFAKFRSKMLALPARMAPKLWKKTKEEITGALRAGIEDALKELANYNPADYYASEHVEFDEDDLLAYEEIKEIDLDGKEEQGS